MAPIVFAQRLAVAQIGGAREHVDLRAGIVDVVLARHREAGECQQRRQRIAEHRAARVADMHRPGRIGGHVFDVDLAARAGVAAAVVASLRDQRSAEARCQICRPQAQVDEARPGDLGRIDIRVPGERDRDARGEVARLHAQRLRQHHGRVGGQIAVAGVARRLDQGTIERRPFTARRGRHDRLQDAPNSVGEVFEYVHIIGVRREANGRLSGGRGLSHFMGFVK